MEKGFIISLILAGIVGLFALSNGEKVEIDLIFTQVIMSQAIVIFVSAFLGAIIVAFLSWVKGFRLKKEIKELNRRIIGFEEDKKKLEDSIIKKEEQIKALYNKNTEMFSKK